MSLSVWAKCDLQAAILGHVEQTYRLKEKPCKPERFLGATIKEFYFQGDAKPRWAMSSNEYVTNAIKTVEIELAKWDKTLSTKAITPLASGYWPELDVSHYLNADSLNVGLISSNTRVERSWHFK